MASGMGLEVFMTGRGTPYGLAAAPVIKVCSRNESLLENQRNLFQLRMSLYEKLEQTGAEAPTGEKFDTL